MFYDYNSLDIDLSILEKYTEKYLVAWSMGVMCATLFNIKYKTATAVNGTLKPIDNTYGIPVKIYNLTLQGLTPAGAQKFVMNMFKEKNINFKINRDFENIKKELAVLKTYVANTDFQYNRVIISSDDKIIPSKNQSNFWGIEPNTNSGHCPFFLFNSWSELL